MPFVYSHQSCQTLTYNLYGERTVPLLLAMGLVETKYQNACLSRRVSWSWYTDRFAFVYFTWLYFYSSHTVHVYTIEWLIFQAGWWDWSMLYGDRIINGILPLIYHEPCHFPESLWSRRRCAQFLDLVGTHSWVSICKNEMVPYLSAFIPGMSRCSTVIFLLSPQRGVWIWCTALVGASFEIFHLQPPSLSLFLSVSVLFFSLCVSPWHQPREILFIFLFLSFLIPSET